MHKMGRFLRASIIFAVIIFLNWSTSCQAADEANEYQTDSIDDVDGSFEEEGLTREARTFGRWYRGYRPPTHNYIRPIYPRRPYYPPNRRVHQPQHKPAQHHGGHHRTGYRDDDVGYAAILG